MSSSDSIRASVMACLVFGTVLSQAGWAQNRASQATFTCPSTIDITETAAPVPEWQSSSDRVKRQFERISIYNGKNGDREYELAPDGQKQQGKTVIQVWRLKGYRTMNIFLRCRYTGTGVVLAADIPSNFETCTFRFHLNSNGGITGARSFTCR